MALTLLQKKVPGRSTNSSLRSGLPEILQGGWLHVLRRWASLSKSASNRLRWVRAKGKLATSNQPSQNSAHPDIFEERFAETHCCRFRLVSCSSNAAALSSGMAGRQGSMEQAQGVGSSYGRSRISPNLISEAVGVLLGSCAWAGAKNDWPSNCLSTSPAFPAVTFASP